MHQKNTKTKKNTPPDRDTTVRPHDSNALMYRRAIESLVDRVPLIRPLAVIDLETTGVSVERDRIVQVGIVRIEPNGDYAEFDRLVNPGIPIPVGASAVHGITDADVATAPTFRHMAVEVSGWLTDADLAGYNVKRFDHRLLHAEFARAGLPSPIVDAKVVDPFLIFIQREARTLAGAMRFYCRVDGFDGHKAVDDVRATLRVLAAQLAKYPDLPTSVDGLHDYCAQRDPSWVDSSGKIVWRAGEPCVNFGRHAGRTLKELVCSAPGFLRWMLAHDFEADTKVIVADALQGRFPVDLRCRTSAGSAASGEAPVMPPTGATEPALSEWDAEEQQGLWTEEDVALTVVDDACLTDTENPASAGVDDAMSTEVQHPTAVRRSVAPDSGNAVPELFCPRLRLIP